MHVPGAAFITGGASGFGKACCIEFAKEGSRGILIADINLDAAQKAVEEVKAVATHSEFRAEAVHVDVTQEESVQQAVDRMLQLFGRMDYCIHSAGITIQKPLRIAESSFSEFKLVTENHMNGTYLVLRAAAVAMKAQELQPVHEPDAWRGTTRGAIVALASVASLVTSPGTIPYNAAKFGVMGIVKSAASDVVSQGIRVNCVCPTWADTPMVQQLSERVPGVDKEVVKSIPMGRLCRPEEVADAILYLCSKRSSFVTGTALTVDGGMLLPVGFEG